MKIKPFNPKKLPLNLPEKDELEIYKKALLAEKKITEFSVLIERNIILDDMMWMFSLNESVQSTKIEGTQATFDEVLESNMTNKKTQDIREVYSYLLALQLGEELLKGMPISTRMILRLHEEILKGGRGQNRNPGAYRTIQNWIGSSNKIEEASYIPPEPQKINEYMSNLEIYINDDTQEDLAPIIKIAIIHAQFETIHPFLDGNGRLGRILIMLYLLDKKVISKPSLFISEELEKNKYKYYSLLNNLRTENPQWKEWILFFLDSVIKQSDKNIEKLRKIEELYNILKEFCKKNNIKDMYLKELFKTPIFTINQISLKTGFSYSATKSNIQKLLKSGYFYGDDKMRNKLYYFSDLLDILRG